jgi:hypothetical protein
MDINIKKIIRAALTVLTGFLALTATAGGIALVAGLMGMPDELIQGSPFSSYTVPGVSLAGIVGGTALFAAVLLICKNKLAFLLAAAAGVFMMVFEFVEVQVIGAPAGIAQNLQILYFSLGTLIVALSFAAWLLDLSFEQAGSPKQHLEAR